MNDGGTLRTFRIWSPLPHCYCNFIRLSASCYIAVTWCRIFALNACEDVIDVALVAKAVGLSKAVGPGSDMVGRGGKALESSIDAPGRYKRTSTAVHIYPSLYDAEKHSLVVLQLESF